ncbi:Hsp20/alpha crystallin family protein [Actinopolymorpha rutila]
MRTDPFREIDRLSQQLLTSAARPTAVPIDAYRKGDTFYVHFDLPGVRVEDIDLTVERNILTVRAERHGPRDDEVETLVAERPQGTFTRQLFLGDTLDTDRMEADYEAGVLTVKLPVAEQAKPRKVQITGATERQKIGA